MKRALIWAACLLALFSSTALAGDFLSASGKLDLRGVVPLKNSDTETEYPSLLGRLKVDTLPSNWHFHMWLEGGWDGTVALPAEDHAVFKAFDKVYQSITPFLEFKEAYGSYANDSLDLRVGIQRFSWGRLDEYPINDLLNPWDYSQFIRKPLEDRKIGVPSVSFRFNKNDWNAELVWVPILVPYRLPLYTERWTVFPQLLSLSKELEDKEKVTADILLREPELPPNTLANGSTGLRIQNLGVIDWGITLFHGYDLRPVFKTKEASFYYKSGEVIVDPGLAPDFHKMSSFGFDFAFVKGDWSFRAEAAYAVGRYFNTQYKFWGYPTTPELGQFELNPNQHQSDSVAYGVGFDHRLFEDCILIMQVQGTVILDRPDTLYDRKAETTVWAHLRNNFMNHKVQTDLSVAYNPEHSDTMAKAEIWYVFTDSLKVGITGVTFDGPPQSLFGRHSHNDQVEMNIVYAW